MHVQYSISHISERLYFAVLSLIVISWNYTHAEHKQHKVSRPRRTLHKLPISQFALQVVGL